MLLRRDATYVTSAILPIRNVNLTSPPIARSVLILKAELFFADHRGMARLAGGRDRGQRERYALHGGRVESARAGEPVGEIVEAFRP